MDDKDFVQLQADYKAYKEHTNNQITELKKRQDDLDKRITSIETSREKTEYQYEQIMQTLEKLNDVTIPGLVKQIQELKNKPAERYNLIVVTIISSIIGGVVGFVLNKVLH